jgi:hypothetical protein
MHQKRALWSVAVPPSIVDRETSTDMVVRESANVTLTCKATGYPEPYVMWRREDGKDINYNGENGKSTRELLRCANMFNQQPARMEQDNTATTDTPAGRGQSCVQVIKYARRFVYSKLSKLGFITLIPQRGPVGLSRSSIMSRDKFKFKN